MDVDYRVFSTKPELYAYIREQLQQIIDETKDLTAILANASALLMLELETVNWAGFYLYKNEKLILGPFQGKPAVAEIAIGSGVCGTAAAARATQLVENVHECCNHIACDGATNSEIVVPILLKNGALFGVLDIDSPVLSRFDEEDRQGLEQTAALLAQAADPKNGKTPY